MNTQAEIDKIPELLAARRAEIQEIDKVNRLRRDKRAILLGGAVQICDALADTLNLPHRAKLTSDATFWFLGTRFVVRSTPDGNAFLTAYDSDDMMLFTLNNDSLEGLVDALILNTLTHEELGV